MHSISYHSWSLLCRTQSITLTPTCKITCWFVGGTGWWVAILKKTLANNKLTLLWNSFITGKTKHNHCTMTGQLFSTNSWQLLKVSSRLEGAERGFWKPAQGSPDLHPSHNELANQHLLLMLDGSTGDWNQCLGLDLWWKSMVDGSHLMVFAAPRRQLPIWRFHPGRSSTTIWSDNDYKKNIMNQLYQKYHHFLSHALSIIHQNLDITAEKKTSSIWFSLKMITQKLLLHPQASLWEPVLEAPQAPRRQTGSIAREESWEVIAGGHSFCAYPIDIMAT